MNPNFQIGPLSFHYYGLILTLAILVAFLTAKFLERRAKIPPGTVEELAIILVIPAIAGARAYHVAHFWNFYSKNPLQILFIWQGGIGIIGAVLAGILVLSLYSKFKKMSFLKLADTAAPAVALGQGIGRIGNFVNLEGFGPPTDLPWGVFIPQVRRPEIWANFANFHPTFFYESAGDFLIFLVLFLMPAGKSGAKFALYLIFYSILRFGLEFLRIDTWETGIIKVAQVISVVGFLAGIVILARILKSKLLWTFKFFT